MIPLWTWVPRCRTATHFRCESSAAGRFGTSLSPMRPGVGSSRLILLTGGSGYIGGRLLKALEGAGQRVRCLARRPDFLRPRVADSTEVVEGDVLSLASLQKA